MPFSLNKRPTFAGKARLIIACIVQGLFKNNRIAVSLLAVMLLLFASCQSRQSVQVSLGISTPQSLHKGKAPTTCATADRITEPTAQQQAKALPEPLFFTARQSLIIAGAESPSFFSRLPLRHTAPPFYVLYKSWKMYLA